MKPKSPDNKISNHLQQDVVKIAGKTIFINPFCIGEGLMKIPIDG